MQTMIAPTPKNGSVQTKNQQQMQVLMTTNYKLFKLMAENRTLNLLHIKRLVESFNEHHIICPIIVNERYEIIDGQHRLQACIETGKPVYYIMIHGYGIKEVQVLNTNQKNWQKTDSLHMYCAQGLKPYIQFKEFMDHFKVFGFQSCERILTDKNNTGIRKEVNGVRAGAKDFENGNLVIPNLLKSYNNARRLLEFQPYYDGYADGTFVTTMLSIFKNKKYNHKEMIHKLKVYPSLPGNHNKIPDCRNVEQYKLAIEDVYNYRNRNKVSFRYE